MQAVLSCPMNAATVGNNLSGALVPEEKLWYNNRKSGYYRFISARAYGHVHMIPFALRVHGIMTAK